MKTYKVKMQFGKYIKERVISSININQTLKVVYPRHTILNCTEI